MQKLNQSIARQKGAALILMAFIIGLAVAAYLLHALDPSRLRLEQDKRGGQILALAQDAIISYSISRTGAGERPGEMPRPDYFAASEAPNFNYDGDTDGGCLDATKIATNGLPQINNGANMRCLGRLPWRTIGLSIKDASQNDSIGNMPWYAVSANLVDSACLKELNSSILSQAYIGYVCGGATLPHPWLSVRDNAGNVISNRVAIVLMIPNLPLTGQSRPAAPLNQAANYLETITVPVGCAAPCVPGVYSNAGLTNEYILLNQSAVANNPNDQLVYITIDELIRAVERRATQEAAVQLKKYYLNSSAVALNRFYPYAASLGDTNNACVDGRSSGLISILPAYADCSGAANCTTDFSKVTVSFALSSGLAFTSNTPSCSRVAGACKCTGAGNCRRGAIRFTCTAAGTAGNCQSTGAGSAGTFSFTYSPKVPDVTAASGACTGSVGVVNCVGGAGKFSSPSTSCGHASPGISSLPMWFTDNRWQDYIYYVISKNYSANPPLPPHTPSVVVPDLTVGIKKNVQALVIASGPILPATEAQPLIGQNRPSININDYLDSLVNTANPINNTIFDSTSKMRANNYNDQPLIVAP